jgi:hypothetical protein
MSTVGLLVAGGSGDDLREQGHMMPAWANGEGPVKVLPAVASWLTRIDLTGENQQ